MNLSIEILILIATWCGQASVAGGYRPIEIDKCRNTFFECIEKAKSSNGYALTACAKSIQLKTF